MGCQGQDGTGGLARGDRRLRDRGADDPRQSGACLERRHSLHQAPGFRDGLPYVLAVVELTEGVRLMTNIIGCPPDQVRIGMPVEVVFEDVTPEITLPKFRPA